MDYPLIILLLCGTTKYSLEWSYSDEDSWPDKYCKKGVAQSPIDLVEGQNTVNDEGPNISFKNLDQVHDGKIINNGRMVLIEFDTANISVSGGRLPGIFHLLHFGFHWNSGHTLNGARKALEVTGVWCNTMFEDCSEAGQYMNGITFISTLYEFQKQDNEIFNPIMESLDKIGNPNTSSKIKLNPRTFLPTNLKKFYRYIGSFTKPDCNDGKPWNIFEELCKVSQNQVEQFMKLKGEKGELLKKTYRTTQKLNQRTIVKITTS